MFCFFIPSICISYSVFVCPRPAHPIDHLNCVVGGEQAQWVLLYGWQHSGNTDFIQVRFDDVNINSLQNILGKVCCYMLDSDPVVCKRVYSI